MDVTDTIPVQMLVYSDYLQKALNSFSCSGKNVLLCAKLYARLENSDISKKIYICSSWLGFSDQRRVL